MPPCKHGPSNSDPLACEASALPTKVVSQSLAILHQLHVTKNSEEARGISNIILKWLPANGAELSYVFLFLMSVIAVVLQLALQHQLMKMCLLCSELDKGIRELIKIKCGHFKKVIFLSRNSLKLMFYSCK